MKGVNFNSQVIFSLLLGDSEAEMPFRESQIKANNRLGF